MATITIDGSNFVVYGTEAGLAAYWKGGLGDAAIAWANADATKRKQAQIAATRLLDRQPWAGSPVGTPVADSVLQWPRSGVTYADGTAVSSASVPDLVVQACYELAGSLLVDAGQQSSALSGSNVKRIHAKGVEVEFFTSTLGISGRLPVPVQDLIGQFLAGATSGGSLASSTSYGTDPNEDDAQSQFDNTDAYVITR